MLRTSMALAHLALGALVAARQCFLHACREAMSLGALRSIVDQPVPLQPLLQQWSTWRRDIAPDAALDALVQRLHESANAGGAQRGASSLTAADAVRCRAAIHGSTWPAFSRLRALAAPACLARRRLTAPVR